MPYPERSGGQVLVDGLVANGARCAFCVPGESYLAALDACYDRRDQLRLIVCRQEGGAAYMAEAFAKLSGEPGVCFVSRGPGASNAMIGVHTAFQDSTPLLLFIGQNPRDERGREAFQELDYARVYDGVAKAVLRIERAADIPAGLAEAWARAIGDRPGPVVVELPEDMLRERAAVADAPKPTRAVEAPSAEAMARFGELLRRARRPAVVFGGAAWSAATNDLLAEFAERHCLPLACAFRRQDMFDNSRAHYVGELGIGPNPALVELFRDADLVVALAARLGEMTTSGYTLFDVPEFDRAGRRKLAHIFPSAAEFDSVYRAEVAIACDAESFLRAAQGIAAPAADERRARMTRVEAARKSYLDFVAAPRDEGAAVRMDRIMTFLRARLPADSVVANGAGNYTIFAQLTPP
ncbi:MAG: thiamine pyrophosphate-binding protein, partial [bacterium]